jgi:hypothetical protein
VYRRNPDGRRGVTPHFFVPLHSPVWNTVVVTLVKSMSAFQYAGTKSVACMLPVNEAESDILFSYLNTQLGAEVRTGGIAGTRFGHLFGNCLVGDCFGRNQDENLRILSGMLNTARSSVTQSPPLPPPAPEPVFEIGVSDDANDAPANAQESKPLLHRPDVPFPAVSVGTKQPTSAFMKRVAFMPAQLSAHVIVTTDTLQPKIRSHLNSVTVSAEELADFLEHAHNAKFQTNAECGSCRAFRNARTPLVIAPQHWNSATSVKET